MLSPLRGLKRREASSLVPRMTCWGFGACWGCRQAAERRTGAWPGHSAESRRASARPRRIAPYPNSQQLHMESGTRHQLDGRSNGLHILLLLVAQGHPLGILLTLSRVMVSVSAYYPPSTLPRLHLTQPYPYSHQAPALPCPSPSPRAGHKSCTVHSHVPADTLGLGCLPSPCWPFRPPSGRA
jgi:hypothetical protein